MAALQTQSRIGGYELVRLLGEGGMGEVWLARDVLADRPVALKFIKPHLLEDPGFRGRFRSEAKTLGKLEHDRIVTLYSVLDEGDHLALVLRFIDGESLAHKLDSQGALPLDFVLSCARDILPALGFAHDQGIIHRDVKPENILVDTQGRCFLMDFGIAVAAFAERGTMTGFAIGTPHYMSPEQIRTPQAIRPETDIYSFGVVLFEMLSGQVPFGQNSGAEDIYSIQYAHCNEPPPRLREINPNVPAGIEAAVMACLEKEPANRPQTCVELLGELERAAPSSGQSARAFPKTVVETRSQPQQIAPLSAAKAVRPETFFSSLWLRARRWSASRFGDLSRGSVPEGQPANHLEPMSSTVGNLSELPPAQRRVPTLIAADTKSANFTNTFDTGPKPTGTQTGPVQGRQAANNTIAFGPPVGPLGAVPLVLDGAEDIALTVVRSPDRTNVGLKAILKKYPFVVGHGSVDFDLFFDPAVSRQHLEIDYRDGRFTISDLNSTNGTFVNGGRLKPMTHESLFFGVNILLGSNTQLIFGPSESREMPDLRGRVVAGRFTLVEKLHGSVKSVVYLATDGKLPRKVAVKILSPSLARYSGYREEFSRDAETASRIRHSNICRVIDYGDPSLEDPAFRDSLYVCTEFLEGGSLADRLDGKEVFALDLVYSWVVRICDALQHIHDHGITHSGLKPSAIIFDEDGKPFLTDFALATRVGEGGSRGFLGAPSFLSPEQFDGEAPIPPSDQYSLAVLAYLLLSGGEPYQGQDDPEIRRRNFRRGALPVHEMCAHNGRTNVPEAISAVLGRAMSVNPKDRFPKVAEFAKAFELAKAKGTADRFPPSVFISHQRVISAPWAIHLKWRLEKEYGIKVFVDSQREDRGGQFPPKLQSSIENTDVFICLLAGSTLASEWVKKEIDIAHRAKKPMIPVFQESFQRPEDLQSLDACLRDLLTFEGIYLLDERGIYIDDAIRDLSIFIRQLAPSADGLSRRQRSL